MAFDPSEARDPRGKWTKLAQAIKKLSEADHTTVANAIGELPKGGHGNRTSIKGVEVRRHRSGAVNVKIGGESRQYASHEDAARAVIRREHGAGTSGTGTRLTSGQALKAHHDYLAGKGGRDVYGNPTTDSHKIAETAVLAQQARSTGGREEALTHENRAAQEPPTYKPPRQGGQHPTTSYIQATRDQGGARQDAPVSSVRAKQGGSAASRASSIPSGLAITMRQQLQEQIKKIEDRAAHRSQSARLKGRSAPSSAADQRDREALLKLYEKLREVQ